MAATTGGSERTHYSDSVVDRNALSYFRTPFYSRYRHFFLNFYRWSGRIRRRLRRSHTNHPVLDPPALDAYGKKDDCRLFLKELNKPDMERYVQDLLGRRVDFKSLEASHEEASDLLDEIVQRSQGVFLWVYLVVRSLIDGLRNADRMSQLHERLRSLPSDLEDYFRHIFLSLDDFCRQPRSHMFQVAIASCRPLSPLAYWYLDAHEDDPTMTLSMPCEATSEQSIYDKEIATRRRIDGRSKGLLEITPPSWWGLASRVEFLHWTVRDFLMTSEMQAILKNHQDNDFNADFAICRALLTQLRVTATMSSTDAYRDIIIDPLECFFLAAESFGRSQNVSPIDYIDEFKRVIDQCTLKMRTSPWHELGCESFIKLAIDRELRIFVKHRLQKEAQNTSAETKQSLLHHSLRVRPVVSLPVNFDMLLMIFSIGPLPVLIDGRM
ncbi:hypothetical protein BU23DRAFT_639374 [Bimuria novae-zelandiae CBS 107.79]|uniref:DUF7791 domain-containing protein n=1 Tax=Bimuria novae-zelandiae CBS 107.79 TaxID=1447943 RepID=A0A6A5V955_9PLEO|nr:hypothetical protein BU23DRAFT_639374 [Bimuria novae-zelandiae CBS 107.79]